ncbi:MAG: hypothetical protein JNK05_35845 [Myxococcales bacterium]|nr:hypothetical protein [Myxococcales bacterium]
MNRAPIVLSVLAMCVGWGGFVARRSSAASRDPHNHLAPRNAVATPSVASPVRTTAAPPEVRPEAPSHPTPVRAASTPTEATPDARSVSACGDATGALVLEFAAGQTAFDRRALDRIELFASGFVPQPDTARRRQALTVRVLSVSAAGERADRSARMIAHDRLDATRAALLRAGLWHMQLATQESSVRADVDHGCVRIERARAALDNGGV